jgi:hypothetical protein
MRSIALAMLTLGLAGCGAKAPSEADQVRDTVAKVQLAVAKRQPGVVCAYYSARTTRAMEKAYGDRCEQMVNAALDGLPSALLEHPIKVGKIDVSGRRALVHQNGGADQMTFVLEDGGWKLDRADRVQRLDVAVCVRETIPGIRNSPNTKGVPAPTQNELARRLCERVIQAGVLPRLGKISDDDGNAIAAGVVQEMRSERKLTDAVADGLLGR